MMWAWWQFKEHKVAICPTDETDYLITDGVYRLTRNPMYLGMILMLFAIAVFVGTLPFYVAAFLFFTIINWVFCPYEEDKLTRVFRQDYADYRTQVRRWI
jgi:protein-S-isoprenylcysteine O-methyltransferase Ste14